LKLTITCALLASACGIAVAQDIVVLQALNSFEVERMPFGSGTPAVSATNGTEAANLVVDGLYHVPNYLPGFPTAATIWPREIPVECAKDPETRNPTCSGYRVHPAVGRGEYIFIRPVAKAEPPPAPAPVVLVRDPCQCTPPKALVVARKKPLG
jgi:hypothetical protein